MSSDDQPLSRLAAAPQHHGAAFGRTAAGCAGEDADMAAPAEVRRADGSPPMPHHLRADAGDRSSSAESVPGNADEPWDAHSAEALTRAYEMAEAEPHEGMPPRRCVQQPAATPTAPTPDECQARLEQRFAAFATMLDAWLGEINPDQSLAAFHQRLERFERRLDAALDNLARCGDASALGLIEAHVGELTAQLAATRKDLGRLEAIDGKLKALGELLAAQPPPHGAEITREASDAALETPLEVAENRAVRQLAPQPADAQGRELMAALEGLLQTSIAERRGDEERSADVLQGIEKALERIVDRITAMETAMEEVIGSGERDDSDRLIESGRLVDAYAAGARALGQPLQFTLDAADYVLAGAGGEKSPAAAIPDAIAAPEPASVPDHNARAREERPASPPRSHGAAASASAATPSPWDEPRARPAAPRADGARLPTVLPTAMALLFATGYLAVGSLLSRGANVNSAAAMARPALARVIPSQAPEAAAATRAGALSLPPAPPPVPPPAAPGAASGEDRPNDTSFKHPDWLRADAEAAAGLLPITRASLAREAEPAAQRQNTMGALDGAADPPAAPELPPEIGSAALRHAAVAGDAAAQFEIGSRFAEGRGVAQDDAQAALWYQRAAARGNGQAQFRLGVCFERGSGVVIDPERAKVWYRRAADQGVVRAMHNLAVLSIGPDQRPNDYAIAVRWFGEAAERGLPDSQFNLGVLFESGLGVEQDLQAAYRWYGLAARAGDKEAARRLERIKLQLAPDQLLAAERQMSQWRVRAEHDAKG